MLSVGFVTPAIDHIEVTDEYGVDPPLEWAERPQCIIGGHDEAWTDTERRSSRRGRERRGDRTADDKPKSSWQPAHRHPASCRVLKFNVQKSTVAGVVGAVVLRVDGFQLPGAVDRAASASTLLRNAVRVRPSGSVTNADRFQPGSLQCTGPLPRVHQLALISTMLRAALSVKVVPTRNPLFTPTFAAGYSPDADTVAANGLICEEIDRLSAGSNQLQTEHSRHSSQ